ncbi:TPA: hypothetical protein DCG61_02240 [Patescibacteria group bacterium]|jgi:hypothetical protein|nr:hypothetical protein [Patescibacteria group bacterium]
MNPLNSPEDLRLLSNIGHWVAGGIFSIIVLFTIAKVQGYLRSKKGQYILPWFLFISSSLALVAFLPFHHGLNNFEAVWNYLILDPQQRQHFIMLCLFVIAGTAELLNRKNFERINLWQFILPAVIMMIGLLFLYHPQHGNHEAIQWTATFHRYLGLNLIFAGVIRIIDLLWQNKPRWFSYIWIIFLSIASIMLITYREPDGATFKVPEIELQNQSNEMQKRHQ